MNPRELAPRQSILSAVSHKSTPIALTKMGCTDDSTRHTVDNPASRQLPSRVPGSFHIIDRLQVAECGAPMTMTNTAFGLPMSDWRDQFQRKIKGIARVNALEFDHLNVLNHVRRSLHHHESIEAMPHTMAVVASGWCFRYRVLLDGRRVVFNFWLPGDLVNLTPMSPGLAHDIAAWGPAELIVIANADYRKLCDASPALVAAFTASERLDALLLANQVMRLGRLTAYERMAHFILEHWERAKLVGITGDHDCPLPMTQDVLADALGLTNFHVSRTLARLRSDKLIATERHTIRILDLDRMIAVCDYDSIHNVLERDK
jgi:CRP-like cAMP-binding protein